MKKPFIIGIISVTIVAVGGGLTWYGLHKDSDSSTSSMAGMNMNTMSGMQSQFEAYKGEAYDRVFIASMIAHHQGAVEMATQAQTSALHPELKTLAGTIISDQNVEIAQMQQWQKDWGFTNDDTKTKDVVKQMNDEMTSMMSQLSGKTGDTFDKAFLTQMKMHHQSAIDMAKPASTNAQHPEVKTLASNIISAQTKEVNQMTAWQQSWGYTNDNSSSSSKMNM